MTLPDIDALLAAHTRVAAPPLVPEVRLHLAEEITPLWEAVESASPARETPPPFWAFPWAGGQALARYVLDNAALVAGRSVLDFGAGSGLVAIAAALAGAAPILAAEIDELAARVLALNAALNGAALEVVTRDIVGDSLEHIDVITLGDMCYEQPLASRVLAWIRDLASAGKVVLLGEPGRNYAPRSGLEELARYTVPTTLELESRTARETSVFRFLG